MFASVLAAVLAASPAKVPITTSSLEALAEYQQALVLIDDQHLAQATTRLKHAIALDPHFASAHAQLANISNLQIADAELKLALADAAKLPEAERAQIELAAAGFHGQDAEARALRRKLVALAPGDWRAQLQWASRPSSIATGRAPSRARRRGQARSQGGRRAEHARLRVHDVHALRRRRECAAPLRLARAQRTQPARLARRGAHERRTPGGVRGRVPQGGRGRSEVPAVLDGGGRAALHAGRLEGRGGRAREGARRRRAPRGQARCRARALRSSAGAGTGERGRRHHGQGAGQR